MPDWYASPHWALAGVLLIIGFWLMIKGADMLVEGGVAIARRFQLSMAVIGATIVAFGTSLPELVVSLGSVIMAQVDPDLSGPGGAAEIAVANIIGSNIFNIGAILGLSALVTHLKVPKSTLRFDYPLMIGVFFLFTLFCAPLGDDGRVVFWEGCILVTALVAFTVLAIRWGKVDEDEIPETDEDHLGKAVVLIVLGILMLTLGGHAALKGAVAIASTLGIPNHIIGLTVMAVGTSLPELITSIQAARKGHADLAIANVVGSNLFNVLSIIGLSSLVLPLPVAEGVLGWDFVWMIGFALLLLPMFLLRGGLGRPSGLILVTALATFIILTIWRMPPAEQEPAAVTEPASAPQ